MDKTVLLATFPEEIWILIFDKLAACPESQRASLNASLFFRTLLRRGSGTFAVSLFPLVWPLFVAFLIQKLPLVRDRYPTWQSSRDLYPTTSKCRLVCRSWCCSVDTCLQTFVSDYLNVDKDFWYDRAIIGTISQMFMRYREQLPDPNSFLNHFRGSHQEQNLERSPLPSGAVHTSISFLFRDKILMVARIYGAHIFHLETSSVSYNTLCLILVHLPNLQTLACAAVLDAERQQEVQQFELPALAKLRNLSVYTSHPERLLEFLRKYGRALEYLSSPNCTIDKFPAWAECPNLKVLKTRINNQSHLNFLDVVAEPETIAIQFGHVNIQNAWPLFYICQQLERKIRKSCRTLAFRLDSRCMPEERMTARLKLKSVRNLKIYLHGWMPLDFLLGMQDTLEVLWVHVSEAWYNDDTLVERPWMDRIMELEEIKILSCYKNMEISNIWTLFPLLRLVKIVTEEESEVKRRCWKRFENTQKIYRME